MWAAGIEITKLVSWQVFRAFPPLPLGRFIRFRIFLPSFFLSCTSHFEKSAEGTSSWQWRCRHFFPCAEQLLYKRRNVTPGCLRSGGFCLDDLSLCTAYDLWSRQELNLTEWSERAPLFAYSFFRNIVTLWVKRFQRTDFRTDLNTISLTLLSPRRRLLLSLKNEAPVVLKLVPVVGVKPKRG